jgi:prepilin-type N-terminal cleavage/methylation domain-containing protein
MRPRGFTLLELLVALVIMGLAAGVVPMVWRVPSPATTEGSWSEVVTTARRLSLGRGQMVELRLDGDGGWSIVAPPSGTTLRAGRLSDTARRPPTVWWRVDALGMCRPQRGGDGSLPFDMAACREALPGLTGAVP